MNEHYVNEEETAQEQLSSPIERHLDFQLFVLFKKRICYKLYSNAMSFLVEQLSVSHYFYYRREKM
jgi:hypothetical protein